MFSVPARHSITRQGGEANEVGPEFSNGTFHQHCLICAYAHVVVCTAGISWGLSVKCGSASSVSFFI